MLGRGFTYIRRFFELAGAIQVLGSLGGATVLAILIPAVTNAVLGLPTSLLIVLGVGVFFVALAAILAILKAVLERRASSKTESQDVSATLQQARQENEDLRRENEELIAEAEAFKKNEPEAGQEFFTPQREVGGVRGSRYYKNEPIYFPDIVRELATQIHKGKGPVLVELTFEGCQIHGPAMLKPLQGNQIGPFFVRCEWEEDLDAFYIKDPEREATGGIGKETGVVGLLDCVFRDCYFKGVGLVTNQETYEAARQQYESPGGDLISL